MNNKSAEKEKALLKLLAGLGPLAVAFSGGADSSYLLAASREALGSNVLAVTAVSPIVPHDEIRRAREFAAALKVNHIFVEDDPLSLADFVENGPMRCFFCKKAQLEKLSFAALDAGFPTLVHGANKDDHKDYRPGLGAAAQLGVGAPLAECGLSKEEIRELSKARGLNTWNKPPMACLATRIPYGEPITLEKLQKVQAAEDFLFSLGFSGFRVRFCGPVARIEAQPEDFEKILSPKNRQKIVRAFAKAGFNHVALDLEGYTTGSLNRALKK